MGYVVFSRIPLERAQMKLTQIHAREKDSPKRNVSKTSYELNIELDKDSRERLLRLKNKLPKISDRE
jgi:hypothetical protein